MASLRTSIFQKIVLKLDGLKSADTTSSFQKTGKLTPEEFVRAGDFLCENFPTWQWAQGLPEKTRSHLPPDKQFIVCRDVPCLPPPSADEAGGGEEREVEVGDDGTDGWIDTGTKADDAVEADVAELSLGNVAELDAGAAAAVAGPAAGGDDGGGDDDDDDDLSDVPSLDGFDYDEAAVDDNDQATLAPTVRAGVDDGAMVVETKTYDVSVTYDVYYSTPRVWLFGYDASHHPLQGKEWQKDFSPEHLNKTVTFESHPHLGYSCPSIHPCKHAAAMLKMTQLAVGESEGAIDAKYYLLIFLKFIQAIIPNIEYDYTGQFELAPS